MALAYNSHVIILNLQYLLRVITNQVPIPVEPVYFPPETIFANKSPSLLIAQRDALSEGK